MSKPPTSRTALLAMGATLICDVTSKPADPELLALCVGWTDLSLYWVDSDSRPYIAVVEGKVSERGKRQEMVDKFTARTFGSIDRALNWFDPSNLADELSDSVPADADIAFPDANTIRMRRAAQNRGYQGEPTLEGALAWLYEDTDIVSMNDLAKRTADDFNLSSRTVYNALAKGVPQGWAYAFIAALRHFDRKAWSARHG